MRRADEPLLLDNRLGRRGLTAAGDLLLNLASFLQFSEAPNRFGPTLAGQLVRDLDRS